jgi:hypothetical protein
MHAPICDELDIEFPIFRLCGTSLTAKSAAQILFLLP